MNSMKVIAPFALAIGALLVGPVSTMIMFPEKSGGSYVYGVIDGLLVVFAIQWLSEGLQNISKPQDEDGSSLKEKENER